MDAFYTSIEPFLALSRFLGFLPFVIDKNSLKIERRKWDFAQIPFFLTFVVLVSFLSYFSSLNEEVGFLDYKIWCFSTSFYMFVLLIIFKHQFGKREDLEAFLKIMRMADLKLKYLGISVGFNRNRTIIRSVLLISIFFTLAALIAILATYLNIKKDFHFIVLEIFCFYYLFYEILFCLEIICPGYLIYGRFR